MMAEERISKKQGTSRHQEEDTLEEQIFQIIEGYAGKETEEEQKNCLKIGSQDEDPKQIDFFVIMLVS